MNPQYPPPGQNNNAPSNPMFPPTSQDYNGVQNANIYSQMQPNGPQLQPKPFDPTDMSQKMQSMNINGSQGFQSIPPTQLPPGQLPPGQFHPGNYPPPSNFVPGQLPPGQRPPSMPGRPPVSGASQMPPMAQKPQMPPMSGSGGPPGFGLPSQSQTPNIDQSKQFQPPTSIPSQQRPPSAPSSQQMPPVGQQLPGTQGSGQIMSQVSQKAQQPIDRSGISPQVAQPTKSSMPPQPQMGGIPMQSGAPGLPQGNLQPTNMPSQSQPNLMPLPGMPSQAKPGFPGQLNIPGQGSQMISQTSVPSQPGMISTPLGMSSHQAGQPTSSSQLPGKGSGPPQQGISSHPGPPGPLTPGQQISGQSNMPSQQLQPGMPPLQPGMLPQPLQSGMPPQPLQPGMPPQSLQPGMPPQALQSGMPPQPLQPGMPPQPLQPGMPPQPLQTGMSTQPGFPPQRSQMSQPGFPPQPVSLGQGFLSQPGQPGLSSQTGSIQQGFPSQPQTGFSPQSAQQFQQSQSMPGLPHMPPPLSQQKQQYPGMAASQPGYGAQPGQQPGGQYSGMPPMPSQLPPQPMPGQQQRGFQQPSSGYPPQYQQQYPGQQPPYPGQQYQQPEQKRLDPEQMPSPIQVMAQDQENRGGVFVTNEKGLVPPLATTDFVVDDKGNASPRYIRSSMYTVPVTADLLKQTSMPFCLVIAPMAETIGSELEPPLIDFAALTGSPTMGPVRCSRCKAYMCPSMKFVDAGRHFKCAFCKATTEVPMEYTQYINSTQQYGRVPAEMALGAYEIVATKEYCRNNTLPNPPAIVFVIDVSYNAIKSGLVQTVCDNILDIIEALPRDEATGQSWTRVGFITYSSTVHFYNIKGSLAQPQMLSVGDVGDMFVPLLEGFLLRREDAGAVLPALLQQLPLMFQDNKETETILLPACQAGLEALKAADTSGQLMVFHTSLPSYNAPGKLLNREDRKLLGTDKEKQILTPQSTAYNELGQACAAAGVSVELFVANNAYVDCATLGQLPRLTGGQLRKYTYFTAELDGARLVWDVRRALARPTAHDAVMRVRTSTGVRPTDFYGHMFMSNTTDVELAAVDADKAIGIEIKHDDKLTAEDGVYIQAALLYTHRSGQRRLRVLNLALNVAHQLADVYRSMELDTCINFLTKQAVWALREATPRSVREALSTRCARSLAAYRRHCASPSSAGQLVLPEPMKLLPLYTSCVLRGDALAGGPDLSCDDRSCAMHRALTADVPTSVVYTYPRLLPLARLPDGRPQPLRASMDKISDQGVYLLENGVHMLMWVGAQASPDFIRDVFGVASPQQVDTQVCELPALDTPASAAVRALIDDTRARRRTAMRLTLMRQHDKLETVLRHFLVEDRGVDGSSSYVDYLCHIHKEIRALL